MLRCYVSILESNSAAWLVGDRSRPLEVKPAKCHIAGGAGWILVKVGAVAINQIDVAAQVNANFLWKNAEYPRGYQMRNMQCNRLLGCDLAGDVVQVGRHDTCGIQVGDRILGLAAGGIVPWHRWDTSSEEGAFQEYVLVRSHLACVIPDTITYEQACVFPLTMTTSACALFHEDYLYMCPPTIPPREPDASSDAVIITDGLSDVGCHAIQLARSAGYWVYSTAPPKYFESVEEFGARRVFDHNAQDLAGEILSAMIEDNRTIAGAVAIGSTNVDTCIRVLSKYHGGNGLRDNNKFIALIDAPRNMGLELDPVSMVHSRSIRATALKMSSAIRSKVAKVPIKLVIIRLGKGNDAITRMVFRKFLPRALASGHIPLTPQPRVVGTGLEKIQEALDVLRDGVTAEKVVVSMQ